MINVHDSDILKMEGLLKELKAKAATPRNYQHFENEIKERFWQIGFKVDVKWWTTNVDGTLIPEIEVLEKIEGGFDPDQQVHEVVNNVVGLPDAETGFIKTDPKEIDFLKSGKLDEKDVNKDG